MFHSLYKKTKQFLLHTNELNLTNREVIINGIYLGHNQQFFFKKRLDKGTFGAVYEAIAPDGQRVAIKVTDLRRNPLKTDAENEKDFDQFFDVCRNEFLKLWELTKIQKEKGVVKVYDIGVDSKRPYVYIIMDIGDENLEDIIQNLHDQYVKMCGVSYSNEYIPADARRKIWEELVAIVATLDHNGISHIVLKSTTIVPFENILNLYGLVISEYESG